jgi:hypothetical protein
VRLQDELLKNLEQQGWSVQRRPGEADWSAWFHEIWVLESRWAPRGFTRFLTFLADPQPGNANPFWVIGTSSKLPESSGEADGEPRLMVTPAWKDELSQFITGLNSLRQAVADKQRGVRGQ